MTQPPWAARLTRTVAGEVRRYRAARRLSAQQLAARCAELGLDLSRATIADLENGRRTAISVAELLVLAAALEVPPILLLMPVGRQQTAEILPGQNLEMWDAVLWFIGHAELTGGAGGGPLTIARADEDATVALFRSHRFLVDRAPRDERALRLALHQADQAETEEVAASARRVAQMIRDNVETNVTELREVRAMMRKRGLIPPELSPDWLTILDE